MSDETPPDGAPVSRRARIYQGTLVPFGGIALLVIGFAVFLFQRIEANKADEDAKIAAAKAELTARIDAVKAEVTARMDAGKAERNAQVTAIERDVVRLQDHDATTSAAVAEIKADLKDIIITLNRIDRKQP